MADLQKEVSGYQVDMSRVDTLLIYVRDSDAAPSVEEVSVSGTIPLNYWGHVQGLLSRSLNPLAFENPESDNAVEFRENMRDVMDVIEATPV